MASKGRDGVNGGGSDVSASNRDEGASDGPSDGDVEIGGVTAPGRRADYLAVYEAFYSLNLGARLTNSLITEAFARILNMEDRDRRNIFLGALLTGLMSRGPTVNEICALVRTALDRDGLLQRPRLEAAIPGGKRLVGVAGSGKKGLKTINITTPAALVAASAGAFVVKVGSRSTSSLTGAVELAAAFGIKLDIPLSDAMRGLSRTGFAMFDVSYGIPRFDSVYGGRFHSPTPLSFALPALLCPVRYDVLLYGLAHPNVELSLKALRELGVEDAMIVSSTHDDLHFVDEMNVLGRSVICGMRSGMIGRVLTIDVRTELGLPAYAPEDVAEGRSARDNVAAVVSVLRGAGTEAHRDVVCVNAANVLYLAGITGELRAGYELARDRLRSGAAWAKVQEVVSATGGSDP